MNNGTRTSKTLAFVAIFSIEWEAIRQKLLNTGYDLSKIKLAKGAEWNGQMADEHDGEL